MSKKCETGHTCDLLVLTLRMAQWSRVPRQVATTCETLRNPVTEDSNPRVTGRVAAASTDVLTCASDTSDTVVI